MATIYPHINFNGNAEEAFIFYKSVFGGEFSKIIRFNELANEDFKIDALEANKIMHIALPIGNCKLMGNDVPAILGPTNEKENRSKICVTALTREEAEIIFGGLCADGQIEMPLMDSPWGTYFGMLRDKYGIEWIIEFDAKNI